MHSIHLDPAIFTWVLLPITIAMTLCGIMTGYFNQSTAQIGSTSSRHIIKHESVLQLCRRFRSSYLLLTPHIYKVYQTHLFTSLSFGISEEAAVRRQKEYEADGEDGANSNEQDNDSTQSPRITSLGSSPSPIDNDDDDDSPDTIRDGNNNNSRQESLTTTIPATTPNHDDIDPVLANDEVIDPSSMVNGMFSSILSILPQMLQFVWITFFFSGYVVAQLPVSSTTPIPTNLKAMFHHSIPANVSSELPAMYISGVSWYVLNLLGLGGIKGIVSDMLMTGVHFSLRKSHTSEDGDEDSGDSASIMYQQTVGMSLPRHDAFQQLNPLALGGNADGGQFKHDCKVQRDEINLLDYNSNTLIYSQGELLKEWRKGKGEENRKKKAKVD